MYRIHFDLYDKPFRIPPNPKYLYMSETHDESCSRILYGIQEARGFVVVTGAIGLGKTTVLLSVLDQLDRNSRTAVLCQPIGSFVQLLRMTLLEFDAESDAAWSTDEVVLLRALNEFLIGRLAAGETCVLMIDEAQNLSLEVLEQLRMLSNLQTEEASLLQIILVGQPELLQRLEDPSIMQLKQRVGVWYEIVPLTREEVRDYIHHRLHVAGSKAPGRVISDRASEEVARLSNGVPRIINQICDTALVIAFGQSAPHVTAEHIREAASELHLSPAVASKGQGESHRSTPGAAAPRRRVRRPFQALATVAGVAAVLALMALFAVGAIRQDESPRSVSTARAEDNSSTPSVAPAQPAHGLQNAEADLAAQIEEIAQEPAEPRRPPQGAAFSVHVASFRESAEVDRWLASDVRPHSEWEWPVYVHRSGGDSPWLRVLVGGFPDLASARRCADRLKSDYFSKYAQPVALASDSQEVHAPRDTASSRQEEAR